MSNSGDPQGDATYALLDAVMRFKECGWSLEDLERAAEILWRSYPTPQHLLITGVQFDQADEIADAIRAGRTPPQYVPDTPQPPRK